MLPLYLPVLPHVMTDSVSTTTDFDESVGANSTITSVPSVFIWITSLGGCSVTFKT